MSPPSLNPSQLEAVLASLADNLYVFDRELRYAFVTPAAAHALGLEPSHLIGRTWRELGLPAMVMEPVEEHVRSVFALGNVVCAETRFTGPRGVRHYEYVMTPARAADGSVELVTAVGRDITVRRHAEERLRAAQAYEEKIIAIVGHDIRSPLGAIDMAAQLLARTGGPASPQAKTVERIARAADRIHHIVADLLDLTRARHGGIPITPQRTSLQTLCRQVLDEVELAAGNRAIEFSCTGDPSGAWDPHRIGQALSNLLTNAVQHSPGASPIKVSIHAERDEVTLTVHNDGHITPELLPLIFDPFRQGHASSAGLGLGLFIAQTIVQAHGGSIGVASTPSDGTSFTVRLPRTPPPPAAAA